MVVGLMGLQCSTAKVTTIIFSKKNKVLIISSSPTHQSPPKCTTPFFFKKNNNKRRECRTHNFLSHRATLHTRFVPNYPPSPRVTLTIGTHMGGTPPAGMTRERSPPGISGWRVGPGPDPGVRTGKRKPPRSFVPSCLPASVAPRDFFFFFFLFVVVVSLAGRDATHQFSDSSRSRGGIPASSRAPDPPGSIDPRRRGARGIPSSDWVGFADDGGGEGGAGDGGAGAGGGRGLAVSVADDGRREDAGAGLRAHRVARRGGGVALDGEQVAEGAHQRARRHPPGQDQRPPPLRPPRRHAPLPLRQPRTTMLQPISSPPSLKHLLLFCLNIWLVCVKCLVRTFHMEMSFPFHFLVLLWQRLTFEYVFLSFSVDTARMGFPFQLNRHHALGWEIGICDRVSATDYWIHCKSVITQLVVLTIVSKFCWHCGYFLSCRQLALYTGPTSMCFHFVPVLSFHSNLGFVGW